LGLVLQPVEIAPLLASLNLVWPRLPNGVAKIPEASLDLAKWREYPVADSSDLICGVEAQAKVANGNPMTVGVASSKPRIVDEEVLAADVAVAQNVQSANNSEGEDARSPLMNETHISLYRWNLGSCHTSNPVEVPRQKIPATKFEIRLAVSIPKLLVVVPR
jgi:hypothetical protein